MSSGRHPPLLEFEIYDADGVYVRTLNTDWRAGGDYITPALLGKWERLRLSGKLPAGWRNSQRASSPLVLGGGGDFCCAMLALSTCATITASMRAFPPVPDCEMLAK